MATTETQVRGSKRRAEAGNGRMLLVSRYEPELIGTIVSLRPYPKLWVRRQRNKDARTQKATLEAGAG